MFTDIEFSAEFILCKLPWVLDTSGTAFVEEVPGIPEVACHIRPNLMKEPAAAQPYSSVRRPLGSTMLDLVTVPFSSFHELLHFQVNLVYS